MDKIAIPNPGPNALFVGGRMIPAGEIGLFDASELPPGYGQAPISQEEAEAGAVVPPEASAPAADEPADAPGPKAKRR